MNATATAQAYSKNGRNAFADAPYTGIELYRKLRADPLNFFVQMSRVADVVRFRLGSRTILMVTRADLLRHILQVNHTNYHKSRFYEPMYPVLGKGIFTAEGDDWLWQRRAAVGAVQGAKLRRIGDQMVEAAQDLVEKWRPYESTGQAFDVVPEMMRVTLEILLRTLFGVRLGPNQHDVYDALTVVLRHAERRIWAAIPVPAWLPLARNREFRRALAVLDDFVYRIVDARLSEPLQHQDYLSILLASRPRDIDAAQFRRLVRDNVLTMIVAGHESTANALSWTWELLSRNPEVERRLRAEIEQGLRGRPPTVADIERLPYTRMVFQEASRLYPAVWTNSRVAVADDEIDGIAIAKGTTLMLSAYVVHRREDYWPNPEGFDPGRFEPGVETTRPDYAYIPFSAGARNCMGRHFATMEGILLIATILQAYRVDLVPGFRVAAEPMISLRPRGGLHIRLRGAPRETAENRRSAVPEPVKMAVAGCPVHV